MRRRLSVISISLLSSACANDASTEPLPMLSPLSDVVQVSVAGGNGHNSGRCALRRSGDVLCWGDNTEGQLGFPSSSGWLYARLVPGLHDVARISNGPGQSCAVTRAGELWCWGSATELNAQHIVGSPGEGPFRVQLDKPVADVACGHGHTCALLTDGSVTCWGLDDSGQAGIANRESCSSSTDLCVREPGVVISAGATAISAGLRHSCAIVAGSVQCWGQDALTGIDYDLGGVCSGSDPRCPATPLVLPTVHDVTQLVSGPRFACATGSQGSFCWGSNDVTDAGSLAGDARLPYPLPGSGGELAAAEDFACRIGSDASVACWGRVWLNGPLISDDQPMPLEGADDIVQMDGAARGMCTVSRAGGVVCFDSWADETKLRGDPVMTFEPALARAHAGS